MTFKQLIAYLKDNPNNYWFKRKVYGWGWVPVTWQGWLVIAGFVIFLIFQSILLNHTSQTNADITLFLLIVFFSVLAMMLICKIKGEPAAWRWGLTKEEKERYKS